MQRNINSLIGYKMKATDGEIGNVDEFYFDDEYWTIRYLILKTGNWFSNKVVLISPYALLKQSTEEGIFEVNLTKEQIRNSPDIDTEKPVSRQQEIELYGHYPWKPYWGSGFYHGDLLGITAPEPKINEAVVEELDDHDRKSGNANIHLRSTEQVMGNHIHAIDGMIGQVADFIIDDRSWELQFFVIHTNNFIGGKKVLLPVKYIREIAWFSGKIFVDLDIDSIKSCSEFHHAEFEGLEH